MEFDPYVQITPTKSIVDPYDPRVASKSAAVVRPAEDWGKILGGLAPTLINYKKTQVREQQGEQDKTVADILGDQETADITERLQKAADAGEIPIGYSPYIVRKLNEGLANKFFNEYDARMDAQLKNFTDPDHDDYGKAVSTLLEEEKNKLLTEKYSGMYGTSEFRVVLDPLLEKHNSSYVKAVHLKRSDANLGKAVEDTADVVASVTEKAIDSRNVDTDLKTLNEDLSKVLVDIQKLSNKKDSTGNFVFPEGKAQKFIFNQLSDRLDALLVAGETESASQFLDMLEHLDLRSGTVNRSDPNLPNSEPDRTKKTSFAYMFGKELTALNAKLAKAVETDTKARGEGVIDGTRNGTALARIIRGSVDFTELMSSLGNELNNAEVTQAFTDFVNSGLEGGTIVPGFGEAKFAVNDGIIKIAIGELTSEYNKIRQEPANQRRAQEDRVDKIVASLSALNVSGRSLESVDGLLTQLTESLADEGLGDTFSGRSAIANLAAQRDTLKLRLQQSAVSRNSVVSKKTVEVGKDLERIVRSELEDFDERYSQESLDRLDLPIEIVDGIQARLITLSGELERVAADAALTSGLPLTDRDGINAAVDKAVLEYQANKVKGSLEPFLKASIRSMVDKRKDRPGTILSDAMTGAETDYGDFFEWMTDYSESDAKKAFATAVEYAKTASKDGAAPEALLQGYYTGAHKGEVDTYHKLHMKFLGEIKAATTNGEAKNGGVFLAGQGRLFFDETKVDLFTDGVTQPQLIDTHRNISQVRAMEGFSVGRTWKKIPHGIDNYLYIDTETGLSIEEGLLDPDFFPVTTVENLENQRSKDLDDKLIRDYQELDDKDYEGQQALIDEWINESQAGAVYDTLPEEHQGHPDLFIKRQRTLLKTYNEHKN